MSATGVARSQQRELNPSDLVGELLLARLAGGIAGVARGFLLSGARRLLARDAAGAFGFEGHLLGLAGIALGRLFLALGELGDLPIGLALLARIGGDGTRLLAGGEFGILAGVLRPRPCKLGLLGLGGCLQ